MDRYQQIFECCKEMDKLGFPQERRDDSWFYVRPDMMIRMMDMEYLKDVDGYSFESFDQLIYQPTLQDLINALQPNNIDFSVNSGIYVGTTYGNQEFRTNGETIWLALAGNWISIKKVKDEIIPPIDLDTLPITKTDI